MTGKITPKKKTHTKLSTAGTALHFHCNRKAGGWGAGAGLPGKQLISQRAAACHMAAAWRRRTDRVWSCPGDSDIRGAVAPLCMASAESLKHSTDPRSRPAQVLCTGTVA